MWMVLKADFSRNPGNPKGVVVLFLFRLTHFFANQPRFSVLWLVGLPLMIFYRLLVEWVLCVELPAKTKVGPGLVIYHGMGLVIHDGAVIGRDVTLRQNTTIGHIVHSDGRISASPVIEDEVSVGANCVIIGPIRVGRGAVVGAGAVVVNDVPDNAVVVGNPAKIIRWKS